jgi:hypothetical protein
VSEPAQTLRDLLLMGREKHGVSSWAALERIGRKHGHKISHTTLAQMAAGTYTPKRPDRPTLEAVAFLTGAPYSEVHEAAGLGRPMKPFADQLPSEVDELLPEHREVALVVIRALLRAQDALAAKKPSGSSGIERTNGHSNVEVDSGLTVSYLTDSGLDTPDEWPPKEQLGR